MRRRSARPNARQSNKRAHNWLVYYRLDQQLLKLLVHLKGAVYDLGCGDGSYREFVLSHADKYVGVDWSDSPHDVNADLIANLNLPLPVADSTADCVLCLSVLEHLRSPELFLSEVKRILKPSCSAIFQVPWQWQTHEAPHDYRRFSEFGLQEIFSTAGFSDIEIVPQSGVFSTIALKTNYLLHRLVKGPKIIRWSVKLCLLPVWWLNQVFALALDTLDSDWSRETVGFIVVVKN